MTIQKMRNIKPVIGDDEPFLTCFYRDVPDGFRFENIDDDFLTDYINDLNNYFADYEIVGQTLKKFFVELNLIWNRNKEIVKKYADYDKTKIHYTYDTVNTRETHISDSTNNYNNRSSTDTNIDVPISDDNNTPSSIVENVGNSTDNFDRTYGSTETLTLDDGDVNKVNELTEKYRSVLDVIINTFKACFIRFECYTY